MEPDLDRLLDFEAGGGLFPQFRDSWADCHKAAGEVLARIESSSEERPRIIIKTADPLSFSSLFLSLCRSNVDLFFFNITWGNTEEAEAIRIADPHWVLGSYQAGRFQVTRVQANRGVEKGVKKGMRVMIPTGGTSGKVKFAVHDWSSLSASAYGFQSFFEINNVASHCVLPLYHVSGFMQLIRSLLSVGKIVFGKLDTFSENHDLLFGEKAKHRFLSVVSTQLGRLLENEAAASKLVEYRAIFLGGGPSPIGVLEKARDLKLSLAPTYGMTETAAQVVTQKPSLFLQGDFSVGRALPHARVLIRGEDGKDLEPGEIGCIHVFSTSMCQGYYGDTPFSNNVFETSDLGSLDASGRLTVLGRVDQVIISGGEKIGLREVEMQIEKTNLVEDVAAFGVEDGEWGMRLVAAYVPKGDFVSQEGLRNALREQLADFKIPKTWIPVECLPRNEVGKIVKDELLALSR